MMTSEKKKHVCKLWKKYPISVVYKFNDCLQFFGIDHRSRCLKYQLNLYLVSHSTQFDSKTLLFVYIRVKTPIPYKRNTITA